MRPRTFAKNASGTARTSKKRLGPASIRGAKVARAEEWYKPMSFSAWGKATLFKTALPSGFAYHTPHLPRPPSQDMKG